MQTNFRSRHLDLDYNTPDKCKRKTVCYDDVTLYICIMCHLLHSFNKLRITKIRLIPVVPPTKECIRLKDLLYYVYASFEVCEWAARSVLHFTSKNCQRKKSFQMMSRLRFPHDDFYARSDKNYFPSQIMKLFSGNVFFLHISTI